MKPTRYVPTIDAPRCQALATPPPSAQMRRIDFGGVGRKAQQREAEEEEAAVVTSNVPMALNCGRNAKDNMNTQQPLKLMISIGLRPQASISQIVSAEAQSPIALVKSPYCSAVSTGR